MSSDEAPSGQSADGFAEGFDEVGLDDGVWEADPDPVSDPAAANLFTAEIEHVDASDWDVDAALIWGDDIDDLDVDGGLDGGLGGGAGLDFPL